MLCGFSNIHLVLSYIGKLYLSVGQKYWLRRTRFDICAGVIISVNFAHVCHLLMFGVCYSQVLSYASPFFTFASLDTFFGVLDSDFLRCSRKIAKKGLLASLCPSVCPSAGEKFGLYWTDSHEIWYMTWVWVSLKLDKNNGYSTWRPVYIYDISPNSSGNEKRFR